MEIILKETIDNLGREGDIVKVKPGYARNYLIPKKKAVSVTKSSLAQLQQEREAIEARLAKEKQSAQQLSDILAKTTIEIARKVGEENKLFGSVTVADIVAKLEEGGIKVDRRAILLTEPIKSIGEHKVSVKVGYQTIADFTVQVVAETTGEQA